MKSLILCCVCTVVLAGCAKEPQSTAPVIPTAAVTFIELGSVNCVPCQQMQPIMKSLSARYGQDQLAVVFIDCLKDPKSADDYHITLMPTQVFLDKNGLEFHRHEGFYPEPSIDSLLQAHGLNPL